MFTLFMGMIDEPEDQQRFMKVYHQYEKLMFYVAHQILHDFALAEDAVQEAFIRIAKNIQKITDTECPQTKSFVVIITRNVAINLYHKRMNLAEQTLPPDDLLTENSYDFIQDFDWTRLDNTVIGEAVRKLPDKERDVITLYYLHGMKMKDIAKLLDITTEAAKKRAQRGINVLQNLLRGEVSDK